MARALDVCVIGGGVSGLVALKELRDECHRVVCFEQEQQVGGTFMTRGLAYQDMRLTVSQHFMAYSSFAPDVSCPPYFWTRLEYLDYLQRFAAAFDLEKHVLFGTKVHSIAKSPDERFVVLLEQNGMVARRTFDAVALCAGAFRSSHPRVPTFNGQDTFAGEIVHSASYRDPSAFSGRRVICVGMGETSADVTRQISDVADTCYLSFRHYPTLVSRFPRGGKFTTDAHTTRVLNWSSTLLGAALKEKLYEPMAIEEINSGDPCRALIADWAMKSDRRRFLQKNDEFVSNVLNGKITVVPFGIRELRGHYVEFMDGTVVEADTIVCCTGYEESAIPSALTSGVVVSDVRSLFKNAFHPELGHRFAFVGWARPMQGGVPACSEMVSRYFALLCADKTRLPPDAEMAESVTLDREHYDRRFSGVPYIRTLVSYTKYMDEVGDLIGCTPRVEDYIEDPALLYRLVCASNICASYRLRGPHADPDGARRSICRLEVAAQSDLLLKSFYREMLPRVLAGRVEHHNIATICRLINERLYSPAGEHP